jgi:hypothetical protein
LDSVRKAADEMAVAFDLRDWLQAACGNLSARGVLFAAALCRQIAGRLAEGSVRPGRTSLVAKKSHPGPTHRPGAIGSSARGADLRHQ